MISAQCDKVIIIEPFVIVNGKRHDMMNRQIICANCSCARAYTAAVIVAIKNDCRLSPPNLSISEFVSVGISLPVFPVLLRSFASPLVYCMANCAVSLHGLAPFVHKKALKKSAPKMERFRYIFMILLYHRYS